MRALEFELPAQLEATAPPEALGLTRDQVRLMVSYRTDNRVVHRRFDAIGEMLSPGDVLAVNTSATIAAALPAKRADGKALMLHLSTRLPADLWIVEVREPAERATRPYRGMVAGDRLSLPAGGHVTLHTPYHDAERARCGTACEAVRLWIATLQLPVPHLDYLAQHGLPIRYGYVERGWPLDYYQTAFACEPGSAEMPSAGRAFTPEVIARLVSRGVQFAPITLHTGVSSLEDHEPPYEEFYRVSRESADLVNAARQAGRRVIAVGTTAVRALETVVDDQGRAHPGEGWTRLVITPERGIRLVDGLLTGLHEPKATHLAMLEALCGIEHLRVSYDEALREGYLWHEFGDLHLILP